MVYSSASLSRSRLRAVKRFDVRKSLSKMFTKNLIPFAHLNSVLYSYLCRFKCISVWDWLGCDCVSVNWMLLAFFSLSLVTYWICINISGFSDDNRNFWFATIFIVYMCGMFFSISSDLLTHYFGSRNDMDYNQICSIISPKCLHSYRSPHEIPF